MWIYKIINKINNKCYIGQTTHKYASQRWQVHKFDAKNKRKDHPLHRAINKYGIDTFEFQVIYRSFDQEDLNNKEIYFIDLYKSMNSNFGYNILAGGKNSKHTIETKRKIGLKSLGRRTFLGRKHTQETKDKIGAIHKGKHISEEEISRMSKTYQFLFNGNIVTIKNLRKFCRDNALDRRSMMRVLKKELKSYKNYQNIDNLSIKSYT